MLSPFPGMDPYLEDPAFWPDFHLEFIVALRNSLRRRLPVNYEARLDEQIKLIDVSSDSEKQIKPDVALLRREAELVAIVPARTSAASPVTLPLLIEEEEYREAWIEIRYRPDHSVVSVLEVLSPTNKSGSERIAYLAKRRAILRQPISLVEIDLLVGGRRISPPDPLPDCDYCVVVARADERARCEVYPSSLRQPLPTFRVPLKPPDGDVVVDLQEAFAAAFEHGGYATSIDYSQPPTAPLSAVDRAWAAEQAGLKVPGRS
ncbi:MAG TPA: DUF4058 family protein [Pirellulales bacterium]|nr:DUF4058 family protein [Pirellulales bacterium]